MTPAEWSLALAIFESARELPHAEQQSFVDSYDAPGHVRAQVLEMLAGDEPEVDAPAPGRVYGRYTLMEALGHGGMGVVYSARDNELGRHVAMKFVSSNARMLPAAMDRLVYEAQAASALNHPNLVTVYEVLRTDGGGVALVTELVEGHALRNYCNGAQDLRRVAGWGAQIARGLAASHARGIVHGDIKPENVMLRADGYVKVLDFGLAQKDGAQPLWESMPLGSLGYMSPEQTRGLRLTPATDVFSLGVVLLELATGTHPFLEATAAATTQAIHDREVVLQENTRRADRALAPLLRAMLEKDPVQRPAAHEVAARLEAIAVKPGAPRVWRWAAVLAAAAGVMAAVWNRWQAPLQMPTPIAMTGYAGVESQPALSPDGTRVAFVWTGLDDANQSIYVKSIEQEDVRRLTTDPREHSTPAWSPDGKWIAYVRRSDDGGDSDVLVRPSGGGEERLVGHVVDHQGFHGLAWWPDSGSLVTRDAGQAGRPLVRLFLDGSKRILTSAPDAQDALPAISPDGKTLAFRRMRNTSISVCRMALTGGSESCLAADQPISSLAWYADSRRLLLGGQRGISLLGVDGSTKLLMEGPVNELAVSGHRAVFGRNFRDINIWRLDVKTGKTTKFIASSDEDSEPEFSPDGNSILFRSNRSGNFELYRCDRAGQGLKQLTRLQAHSGSARWSPDGRWIAFGCDAATEAASGKKSRYTNIYVMPAEGGEPKRLSDDSVERMVPGWSRDSRWIYFTEEPGSRRETWKVAVEGGVPVRVSNSEMFDIVESDDSKWLYYARPRDRAPGVWRSPIGGGAEERVPGTENLIYRSWDLRGNRLFFLRSGADPGFVSLDIARSGITKAGAPPKSLFNGPRNIAASPDGKTILYTQLDVTVGDLYRVELTF